MKKWISIIRLFVISFLFQTVTSAPASAQTLKNNVQATMQIPEHVIYEFYFRRMAFFENLAQKEEKEGRDGNQLRVVISDELEINGMQSAILAKIGAQALAQAAAMDERAAAIIQREHSRYPGGKLPSKDQVPQMPPELTELQASRDSIFLNAKAQLSQQIEAAAFQEIDSRIKAIISPTVSVKSPH